MTEQEKEQKEEQLWFKNVQKKLKRRIASPKWDSLLLTTIEWDIVFLLTRANNVNSLPILINERVTDNLFNKIDSQFKQMKGKEL